MGTQHIHLGYAIPSGDPVEIPLRHTVVTGQSQEAGKTTTLEALIERSNLRAITFVTKRGEGAFSSGHRLEPYFREIVDWQYVSSILEATLKEKMKFQRSWIMKVCEAHHTTKRGHTGWARPNTLAEVLANVETARLTATGIHESVYTELRAYLQLIVPEVQRHKFADSVRLQHGINVMDLTKFRPEMQALILRSVMEWVSQYEANVITIIPEAWEFIPRQRNSPVKLAAAELIRKGAALRNYVWVDSQDIAGIDYELLRQMPLWLLGVQRERNEVKRTLDQIPDTVAKPKPAALMTQGVGEFYACFGKEAIRTFVQPAWMTNEQAAAIARGEKSITDFPRPRRQQKAESNGGAADPGLANEIMSRLDQVSGQLSVLNDRVVKMEHFDIAGAVAEQLRNMPRSDTVDRIIKSHYMPSKSEVVQSPYTESTKFEGKVDHPLAIFNAGFSPNGETDMDYAQITQRLIGDQEFINAVASKVLAHVPASGVVKVEAKEYILREYLQAEVKRIMDIGSTLTSWQWDVIRLLTAKQVGLQKAEILKAITGKTSDQQAGSYKQKYNEIDELTAAGFLRQQASRFFSNIDEMVKARLTAFNPTDQDISDTVNKILLQSKAERS